MRRRIWLLVVVAATSLLVTTTLVWIFERDNEGIRTYWDVVWWWVVTSATVGYGDVVPVTWPGRIVAMFTIVTGFFVFANLIAIAAESAHAYFERRSRGTARVHARNHIVICEYTAVADELIRSLPNCAELAGREVAIVSDLVALNPYPQHHFVRGVPISPTTLRQANVEHADYVFVFANLRFSDPDLKTLHIALRVAQINPRARVLVEMVDPSNDLLQYAPQGVVAIGSRELIRSVLRDRALDPLVWIRGSKDPAGASR